MEHLGYIYDIPSRKKDGSWKPVDIVFEDDTEFNKATSRLIRMLGKSDSDGKCIVTDSDDERYLLENVHVTFDVYGNTVTLFPIDCRKLNKN
jgi:hypothetical protein